MNNLRWEALFAIMHNNALHAVAERKRLAALVLVPLQAMGKRESLTAAGMVPTSSATAARVAVAPTRPLMPAPVLPAADTLTVLRVSDGRRAAKRIRPTPDGGVQVDDYDAGALFRLEKVPVSGIESLAQVLTGLAGDPNRLAIRGALAPNRRRRRDGTIFRRKVKGTWQGFFIDQPRHWLLVDIDALPLPPGLTQVDAPDAVVEHVLALMGEPWRSATVFWKASSKAGLPGVGAVKLHLWFWLNAGVDSGQARAILTALNERTGISLADLTMADAIQIHYTAAPVFVSMADPLPRRSGLRRGTTDMVPTALVLPTTAPVTVRVPRPAKARPAKGTSARRTPSAEPAALGSKAGESLRQESPLRCSHYAAVLEDVRKLAVLRHGGAPLPDGQRDILVFAAAVAAANADPANFEAAVTRLAADWVPDKDGTWVDAKLVSLREGVRRHLDGERIVHNGRTVSPIYGPSVAWLIRFLDISSDEMETLSVLVSEAVRKRRRRNRIPRQEWQAAMADESDQTSVFAVELVEARGLPVAVAAEWMGVSPRRVRQIVAAHDWNRDYDAARRR